MAIKFNISASLEHIQPVITNNEAWIGVDLDGTLAVFTDWEGWDKIGEPIMPVVNKIKEWIGLGIQVRVFTARVSRCSLAMNKIDFSKQSTAIQNWCLKHIGVKLACTAEKDPNMIFFLDDSCVQIEKNIGQPLAAAGYTTFANALAKHQKNYELPDDSKDDAGD